MNEIMKKLSAISGMLEMLSCMQGCTITGEASSLLISAVEMLDGVGHDLMKYDPDEGK